MQRIFTVETYIRRQDTKSVTKILEKFPGVSVPSKSRTPES
jgi:hypothetical protein